MKRNRKQPNNHTGSVEVAPGRVITAVCAGPDPRFAQHQKLSSFERTGSFGTLFQSIPDSVRCSEEGKPVGGAKVNPNSSAEEQFTAAMVGVAPLKK